jgi:SAM-dependent methyltransferase
MKDWYKEWFSSDLYLAVYRHRNEEDAKKIINLIKDTIQLQDSAKILDAACGAGRHANYLLSLGYDVSGFDLSRTLLKIAVEEAKEKGLSHKYICSDIRNTCFKSKFDLIVNLFTSFGYFETDEENFRFIYSAYKMLNEKGFYVLDYLNEVYVKDNLVGFSEKEILDKRLTERREIRGSRVYKEIILSDGENEEKYFESVQLYSREIIDEVFNKAGYRIKYIFGDYSGSVFNTKDSPRLILILQK